MHEAAIAHPPGVPDTGFNRGDDFLPGCENLESDKKGVNRKG
jgi:hypothetical protein